MEFKYRFYISIKSSFLALELFTVNGDSVDFWDYLAIDNVAQGFSIIENMHKNSGGMMHFAPM